MSAPAVAPPFTTPTRVGPVSIEPFDADRDAALLQGWLADPASAFWQMGSLSVGEVRDYVAGVVADPHQDAWLGRRDGEPVFFAETYDPARVLLTGVHDALPGDLGMHVLVAPPRGGHLPGLTDAVFTAVLRFCLGARSDGGRGALRVVVEPDVRNERVAAKNAAAGFRVLREVPLPGKRAALSVCTREDFAASPLGTGWGAEPDLAGHLRPDLADRAHRHLVAKAIAEFTHERLFLPERADGTSADGCAVHEAPVDYVLGIETGHLGRARVEYRFAARRYALEHWVIDEASLVRAAPGAGPAGTERLPVDALELVAELQPLLGVPDDLLPVYLEELSSTLAGTAAKLDRELAGESPSTAQLVSAFTSGAITSEALAGGTDPATAFQAAEAAMTEGHPGFVANNGRIGFSLSDYRAYAPERGERLRLMWLAARREHAHLALGAGQTEEGHYGAELSSAERAAFADRLTSRGLDPADYLYLPVHPWQWEHRVPITFAADVARGNLVPLGPGADEYQPQQSIRTLFNRTRPARHYVKVATAIQNMGFLRGLSPAYMRPTPAINDWVADLVTRDATLQAAGFGVLREIVSVGYTGDVYHRTPQPNPYRKMLAALWRESPLPRLAPGERVVTMASLLHRDASGEAFATGLVRASGIAPEEWLRAYLDAYLYPLVHCLLAHDLAFMPHGENLILVLRDGVVRRALMKDIGEEIAVLGTGPLPADIERVRAVAPDTEKALAVFTDVFDGVLRHLAGILTTDGVLREGRFWALVAETIDRHRAEHPGLESGVDLRAARFDHSCLNRLQLRNTLQMVNLADQSASLIYAGTMPNPVARG
ncbi:GNAT family N-acetyltransferase [Antribacter sp. KLBMP9083]|uniref:Lysine N-acyltransferase MbtK n=1 Tax=Antribacter soli TaxID=2910976 RepID=A0AA41QE02_9MICO|nr:GNAT family N-acetyltransferase [Antribacter soli]MCF4120861.1 GNAT family N-acetyltransferase [Antribacter soli]